MPPLGSLSKGFLLERVTRSPNSCQPEFSTRGGHHYGNHC